TLCTIPGVGEAIRGIARVLKPGGKLHFVETGVSPDPRVRRWQRRWEPIHRRGFAGLYLTRDIPSLLAEAGFQMGGADGVYPAACPKSWTHGWWGTAILPSREPPILG